MFTLHGYIITEEIHENDRLKVYRGQRVLDRLPVIIKVLKAVANPSDIAKIMNEYDISRNLDIGGIIKPVRMEWAGLTIALVMEDTGAISIKKYLQTSRPDLPAFFSIAMQLAQILGELHQKGVVHRNLKLDTIFIHADTGRISIADFSMAALLSQKEQQVVIPPLAGTMAYMSPEQIGRTNKSIDHRSDFYSLGVVFYEMLTGQLPLRAGNDMQWVYAHLAQKPVCPEDIKPDIPQAISAIIMKLLSKTAGDRYQSAFGLLADLEECRRQWNQTGGIEPLILGRKDVSGLFQLPRKLYGREKEVNILTAAFKSVCFGHSGLLLVHGYAGTGKTALIHEVLKPLAAERGYFISGKFDQLQQNIPYAPFIQAFGALMRQFLTESQEDFEIWKRSLLRSLGRNGAVIAEVIPEIALVVGPQPPVEILQPKEAQNRFRMVLRNFIQAIAQKESPLVIFLDDLQWADQASLHLLQYLCDDPGSRFILLIAAYRDNEVTGTHPLMITLKELEQAGTTVQHIPLAPLDLAQTNEFVADTLQCVTEKSHSLAEILYCKTGGNPFYLGQLLQLAHDDNLLRFDTKKQCQEWEVDAIQTLTITGDESNFMRNKLKKLPDETQKVLSMAACMGNTFYLKTLAIVCEKTPSQTVTDLWPSILAGFVLPVNETGKTQRMFFLVKTKLTFDFEKYKFLHDSVQQAAYSLVSEEEKKAAHVQIGRLILQNTDQSELVEKIFDIMDHINRGLDLITDPAERMKLAEYNLVAGKKAKAATDYGTALNYFTFGIELLPDNAWDAHYRLTFDLYEGCSQCEFLCAHFKRAEQLFDLLLAKGKTDLEKADIYVTKIVLSSSREKNHETLQLGIKGLNLLGIKLPKNPGKIAFIKEVMLAKWLLRNRKAGDVADLPEMSDPLQKRVMLLLLAQAGAACTVDPELYALIIMKISNLSIKFGNTEFSPIGYAGYSFITASVLGDYKTGREFEIAALKLVEKYENPFALGIFYFLLGTFVSHWAEHGNSSVHYLQKAVDYGLESGNLLVVNYALNSMIENKYLLGVPLDELYKECRSYHKLAKAVRLLNYQMLIGNLTGLSNDPAALGDGDYHEEEFSELIKGEMNSIMTHSVAKIQLYYLNGDYCSALTEAERAQENLRAIKGFMLFAEYIFYYSLAITGGYDALPAGLRKKFRKTLQQNQRQMRKWSDACPANFLHKYLLVSAEIARLNSVESESMTLYDRSIQAARENGFIQNEAIACELAARFYLGKGRDRIAQVYLTEACQGYARWGAVRKVRDLQDRYSDWLTGIFVEKEIRETTEKLKSACQFAVISDSGSAIKSDLHAIRTAIGKLSDEMEPETLLKSFLEIAIENAGADKGYMILEQDEKMLVEAAKESDSNRAEITIPLPLEKAMNISQAMVRYVARTLEPVVLNDMEQAGIFARDPYIAQARTGSIACLPLMFQAIPVGVLYLENSLMTGIFTPDRLEVLKLLSNQMACVQKLQRFLAEGAVTVKGENLPVLIESLTERELEVLNLIAAGMSNKEIAQELQLTVNTIKTHILSIYGKLQVNRRVQAITRAKELKLLKTKYY